MKNDNVMSTTLLAAAVFALLGFSASSVNATEPCGDFGECKALIEINATDGDIGFHSLMDGDDLIRAKIKDPTGQTIFRVNSRGPLREQFLTEIFLRVRSRCASIRSRIRTTKTTTRTS